MKAIWAVLWILLAVSLLHLLVATFLAGDGEPAVTVQLFLAACESWRGVILALGLTLGSLGFASYALRTWSGSRLGLFRKLLEDTRSPEKKRDQ